MKHLKAVVVLFGITMAGEFLKALLPLPVPAGVYGLFILLLCLCTGLVKVDEISGVGDFLLDTMPLMFIPAAVGLPVLVISVVSTLFVMIVTGKMAQGIIRRKQKGGESRE